MEQSKQKKAAAESAKQQSLSSLKLLKMTEYLAEKSSPARLIDIAHDLDMTQSTVLRYIKALCSEGYAYQDPATGNYALTWKLCRTGEHLKNNQNLRSIVNPFLLSLARELEVGALLATQHEGDVIYLDVVGNPSHSLETLMRIGKDAPIHSTGSGKILLSGLSNAQVNRVIHAKGLPRLTEKTITDAGLFMEEIEKVRKQGYAFDDEECEIGHSCISVPLYDYSGRIIAAISAFDNTDDLTEERISKKILPALQRASREISFRLGY